ncbi:crossover junction endodeoxyribonuclease RuvC [Bacillus stercoris]|nr:crossover junction endodeoxyribonuclease RuvC [Bacillus stercoris]
MGNYLGIDPSSVASGFTVMDKDFELLEYGVIKPNKNKLNIQEQAAYQFNILQDVIRDYDIKWLGCEDQFRGPNADTFKQLSRISGYIILLAGLYDLKLKLWQPSAWRKTVHGNGNTKKIETLEWANEKYGLSLKKKIVT